MIEQITEGMEVRSSEGAKLGKVAQVYIGSDPTGSTVPSEDETCIEVRRGLLGREAIYIPCRVVADVSGAGVTLNIDQDTVNSTPSWYHKPSWVES